MHPRKEGVRARCHGPHRFPLLHMGRRWRGSFKEDVSNNAQPVSVEDMAEKYACINVYDLSLSRQFSHDELI